MKSIIQLLEELNEVNTQLKKVNDTMYIKEKCKEIYGENHEEVFRVKANEIVNKCFH